MDYPYIVGLQTYYTPMNAVSESLRNVTLDKRNHKKLDNQMVYDGKGNSRLNDNLKKRIRSTITNIHRVTRGMYTPVIRPDDVLLIRQLEDSKIIGIKIINYGLYKPVNKEFNKLPLNVQQQVMMLALTSGTNRPTNNRATNRPTNNRATNRPRTNNTTRAANNNVRAVVRQPRNRVDDFIKQTYPNFNKRRNTAKRVGLNKNKSALKQSGPSNRKKKHSRFRLSNLLCLGRGKCT